CDRLHLYLSKLRSVQTSLDGNALRDMGIPEGPRLGEAKRMLIEARLDHRVNTVEEEVEMVQRWLRQGG
ncbi:MAG: hypothetical protein NTU41_01225, partial [Chloroflexi bacterium]|nr:hypothetical protein [Chloroflexota bacterium]